MSKVEEKVDEVTQLNELSSSFKAKRAELVKCPYCGELMRADLAETFVNGGGGKGLVFADVCHKCFKEVKVEIVPRAIVSKVEVIEYEAVYEEKVDENGLYAGDSEVDLKPMFVDGEQVGQVNVLIGNELKSARSKAVELLGLDEIVKKDEVNDDKVVSRDDKVSSGGCENYSSFSFKASERLKGAEELVNPALLNGC